MSSQRTLVLEALRTAGEKGLCLADVPLELSYTLRNRIGEIRRQGKDVRSELCRVHAHDGPIARYTLREAPASRSNDLLIRSRFAAGGHPAGAVVGGAVTNPTTSTNPVQQAMAL